MRKIKITHIITGLSGGGAENMLYKLLKSTDRNLYDLEVISLTNKGIYGDIISEDLGIKVHICNMKLSNMISSFRRAVKLCESSDIIQTWMYHSNFLGYFISKKIKKPIIWGIHHSNLEISKNKFKTILIAKICSKFSKEIDVIVSCGDNVKNIHTEIGYSIINHKVIYNGIDLELFNVNQKSNYSYSQELGIDPNKKIILHVGRWDPLKDYNNLLNSMKCLLEKRNDFHAILVGTNLDNANEELIKLIEQNGIKDNVSLLGRQNDVSRLMSSADVFVLSSSGEGLPNVLIEAIACGTCCVTTDVGDCKNIVGEYGEIVSPGSPRELAAGINKVLSYSNAKYQQNVQGGLKVVTEKFNLCNISEEYQSLYKEINSEKSR